MDRIIAFAIILCLAVAKAPAAETAPTTAPVKPSMFTAGIGADGMLRLPAGRSQTVHVNRPYKRLIISSPDVAEVSPIGPTQILVTGKSPGETDLIAWDDQDTSDRVNVIISPRAGEDAPAQKDADRKWELDPNAPISAPSDMPGFVRFGFRGSAMYIPITQIAAVVVDDPMSGGKATRIVLGPGRKTDLPGEIVIPKQLAASEQVLGAIGTAARRR